MSKLTRETLEMRRRKAAEALAAQQKQILICAGTGCIAGGSMNIYQYIKDACIRRGLNVQVGLLHEDGGEEGDGALALKKSGCHGFCEMGPLLQINPEGILYTHVSLSDCDEIIEKTILGGELIPRLLYQLDGIS